MTLKFKNKIIISFFIIINLFVCFYPLNFLYSSFFYFILLNLCSILIFKDDYFSLKKIFMLFFYFFFGVAPIVQLKSKVFFFGSKSILNETDFQLGCIISILIILIYILIDLLFLKIKKKNHFRIPSFAKLEINYLKFKDVILMCFLINLIFLTLNNFNVKNFFYIIQENGNNYKFYALTHVKDTLRLIPVIILLYIKKEDLTYSKKYEYVLFINVILLNFPTGISRYQLALSYFPLMMFYFPFFKKYFSHIFTLSFLIIFPYFHEFRNSLSLKRDSYNFFKMFNELHFDSFQNTMSVIKLNIMTSGNQLKQTFLFMIPRGLWTNKPISTSKVLCHNLDYDGFCNIAISYIGEGYVNFGYLGVLIFMLIVIFFNIYFDNIYWNNKRKIGFNIFYTFMLFLEFYLLRGSLTSSYVKLTIILFAFFLTKLLLEFTKFNIKIK